MLTAPTRILLATCLFFLNALSCLPASAQGVVWEAQRGGTTLYLLGSIHVCDASCYPLSAAAQFALHRARVVAVEIDPGRPEISAAVIQHGFYPPEQSLRPLLQGVQLTELDAVLTRRHERELAPLLQMRPWLFQAILSSFAAERIGLDSQLGVDLHVMTQARAWRKPVLELETLAEQMEALEYLSGQDVAGSLKQAVRAFEDNTLGASLASVVDAWKHSDRPQLQAMVNAMQTGQEKHERVTQLMQQRNRRMTERMMRMAEQHKTVLVVVGVAHYLESGNILELLRAQGFTVRAL